MKLLIKTLKNKQEIDEFVFEYDRNDEKLVIPIFDNRIMYVEDNGKAIIKKEKVEDISFIKELFIAANNYCDKNTSPQYLGTNHILEYVAYYIDADRICMLSLECGQFITLLDMDLLKNPIYENPKEETKAKEIITKIENLQKFFKENKDKCDEFAIYFQEREFKDLNKFSTIKG